ncbi:MAG: PilZ domain-containing protein [Terriglobia bacterium]
MSVPMNTEHRIEPRITPRQSVPVDYPGFKPHLRDVSLSGAFIEDPRPLSVGRPVEVRLWLAYGEAVSIKAMVRRVEEGRGMGVEFLGMSEADWKRLRMFCRSRPSC